MIWDQRLKASMGALWDGQQLPQLGFDDYFEHVPLAGPDDRRARPVPHPRAPHHPPRARPARCSIEAAGRTLGYSSDTAFDPELIAFLAPADLIIHETNFGPAHTPYAALAALPAELRARMRLIHYPDGFDIAASNIAALREGDVIVV